MGDTSEMVLEGILCEGCGEYLGEAVGHPRKCVSCRDFDPDGPSDAELKALEKGDLLEDDEDGEW